MGQYFAAVNTDKHEFVCPWCIGSGAKLWEWAANPSGAIFSLLLRKSDCSGGGDVYGYGTRVMDMATHTPSEMASALLATVVLKGRPVVAPPDAIPGRWAGDRVAMIGDYDTSGLWKELYEEKTYTNISRRLVDTWNAFIDIPEMRLTFNPDCSCNKRTRE